jgi:hypothetical protein
MANRCREIRRDLWQANTYLVFVEARLWLNQLSMYRRKGIGQASLRGHRSKRPRSIFIRVPLTIAGFERSLSLSRSSSVYSGYPTDVTFPGEEGTKMSRRFLLVLSLSFVISALAPPSFKAQSGPMRWKDNHVPVRLLPGYKITGYTGFEGDIHGKIWKDGGPTIEYSLVDLYAGDTAGTIPKDQQLWREEQTVGTNHLVCVYTRSNELVVMFSQRAIANFRAKIRDHKRPCGSTSDSADPRCPEWVRTRSVNDN